ncbi:hypothetical protein 162300220 [Organic Lake phycodnavirus 2]|jgi:hypothetical protein|nr:hypothetical protein 162300220 [Organic Lake phycodnavirus 2]
MSKPELYYSKYCKHSSEILEELNKHGLQDIFTYICIDSRTLKDNAFYINLLDGTQKLLPPMINRVPILLLKPNYEILSGNQILEYIKPQSKNIEEETTKISNEPSEYSMTNTMTGVVSDSYSFLDMSPDELSAKGNGGIRQMYNYSTLNESNDSIPTPLLDDKKTKLDYSLEQLEKKRNEEIHLK